MQEITKAQEETLKALWKINEGAISDVLNTFQEPRPAYNTIATVIKVLEKKGYVSHKTYGKTNVYYPIVTQKEYGQHIVKDAFKGLFNGSLNQMVSYFVKDNKVGIDELEKLKKTIEIEIKNKK
jgi:predicted transcriptional regulator